MKSMVQFNSKDSYAAAQDLAAHAKQKLQGFAGPAAEKFDTFLRDNVQSHPIRTLAVVAAAGFLIGRRSHGIPWAKIAEFGLSNIALLRQQNQ